MTALDCYDWDEWTWALLARGIVMNMPERSFWERGVVVFEHPLPNQLIRALRLMGGPGERRWTWRMSEGAFRCFEEWRHSEI